MHVNDCANPSILIMKSVPLRIFLGIACIWLFVAVVVWGIRGARPTPAKLADYLEQNQLVESTSASRESIIDRVVNDLNRMDFDQRREVQRSPELRGFVESLETAEREDFVDRTLPEGFRQMMLAFNRMEPAQRKRYVDRALADLESMDGETPGPEADTALSQKIVEEGLQSFYSDASAEVKLDFAPLLEQIQRNLQRTR